MSSTSVPPLLVAEEEMPAWSDPDDFAIYSVQEAEHIAYAVSEAFDVDIASEVVLAAANVVKLAKRIAEARRLLLPPLVLEEA